MSKVRVRRSERLYKQTPENAFYSLFGSARIASPFVSVPDRATPALRCRGPHRNQVTLTPRTGPIKIRRVAHT
jgi:hypothetical protein